MIKKAARRLGTHPSRRWMQGNFDAAFDWFCYMFCYMSSASDLASKSINGVTCRDGARSEGLEPPTF